MKHLIAIILMACLPAWAYVATPAEIRDECVRQMAAGICTTKPAGVPGADEVIFISGAKPISARAWYDYASLFNEAQPADPAMCDLALLKTSTEPGSDHDIYARAVWTPVKPEAKETPMPSMAPAAAVAALALVVMLATARRKPEPA